MRIAVLALLIGALLGIPGSRAADPDSFVVIVAATRPDSSIKRQELARFYLKKTSRWSNGQMVVPVDQSANSPVRRTFTSAVLSIEGMSQLSAVQAFWLQQVYSGRNTPPAIKATDAEVIDFVAANPGAIGYVGAAPAAGGVKVLTVTE